ncbi:GAF domain-containing protein [uncultured Maribacter sp.]|uniref:GAF domain-containing protein n=1 Tax=uncultured Maribacter sp. TaxID=431308 RepID=UPI0026271520|nr:GAF domain-containing protein [uncultured Maribacter sp.]
MEINNNIAEVHEEDFPLVRLVSFNKLLKHYDEMANSDDAYLAHKANYILNAQAPYPELREGFTDINLLEKHKDVIKTILQDTFSVVLGENEIKAASFAYNNTIFQKSVRLEKILKDAGPDFKLEIKSLAEEFSYILGCTVILNIHYGFKIDLKRPLFYDIPDKNGVMRHYRILYNADFMELIPTDKAKELTQEDVNALLENFDNIDVWKEKIPPNSFIAKGFVISNLFDVTAEHSISEIKSSLISNDKASEDNFVENLQETFRSFFNIRDIRVGFVSYNSSSQRFEKILGKNMDSFMLNNKEIECCNEALCQNSYSKLIEENNFLAIPDVDKAYKKSNGQAPFKSLKEQGIKSAIFAPIANKEELLGVVELVSTNVNELNGVNAQKLNDIMPFIISAVMRSAKEEENLIDAIIQHECTTVHSSVYWRFKEEAKRFMVAGLEGKQPSFKEIVFKDIFPLYGQIDIKDSSQARNNAIQKDLIVQLSKINKVLTNIWEKNRLPIYEELIFRVNNHLDSIEEMLYTNSEQSVFDFVKEEITPIFNHIKKTDSSLKKEILQYEENIDVETESYYFQRKNYDESVMQINKKLASVIDKKQLEAQKMFPHYFERYKTDGVEHNIYIGDSIADGKEFNSLYLNNLRLWQLQVMCEMENVHYSLKKNLPVQLDVASLILVHNSSLSIRFRMDEKQFDVDGTYNARYEIIKKRIDKSYIKGTRERLTQTGKLAIVYSQKKDELEYLRYIRFLKSKGYFTSNIEIVEIEGLQGVSGLKAIRAEILYKTDKSEEKTYTYEDLMQEIKD